MKSLESKYREQLKKNEADSYSAYVSKQGIRTDEQYADALDKASLKKILADTNYGALAERLRKTGLNASGYEDYVRSENVKDHTSAVNTAKEKRAVGEHLNRSGYKSYLSNYEKIQTTLSVGSPSEIAYSSASVAESELSIANPIALIVVLFVASSTPAFAVT